MEKISSTLPTDLGSCAAPSSGNTWVTRGGRYSAEGKLERLVGPEGATLYLLSVPDGQRTELQVGKPHTTACTGHEAWIGKTQEMLLSVAARDEYAPEKGNLLGVRAGQPARVVGKGYRFNHVGVSRCGRFYCCDDWRGSYQVVIGSTQTGNPLACAAAVATIETYRDEGLIENAAAMGAVLESRLLELQRRHRCISDVRAMGLLACVELVADPETREPLSAQSGHGDITAMIKRAFLERGLELRVVNHFLLIGPPLSITADEIGWALGVVDDVLGTVEAQLAS